LQYACCVYLCWLNIHTGYLLYKFCATVAVYNESGEGYYEARTQSLIECILNQRLYWIRTERHERCLLCTSTKSSNTLKEMRKKKLLQEAKQNCFSSLRNLAPSRNWEIVMKGSKCLNEKRTGVKKFNVVIEKEEKWIGSPPIKNSWEHGNYIVWV